MDHLREVVPRGEHFPRPVHIAYALDKALFRHPVQDGIEDILAFLLASGMFFQPVQLHLQIHVDTGTYQYLRRREGETGPEGRIIRTEEVHDIDPSEETLKLLFQGSPGLLAGEVEVIIPLLQHEIDMREIIT